MAKRSTYIVMVMGMESSYAEEKNGLIKTQFAEEFGMAYVQMVGGLITSLAAMSSQLDYPTTKTKNKIQFF